MKTATIGKFLRGGRGLLLGAMRGLVRPMYRATFIAAAAESGLLKHLAAGPRTFEQVAADLGCAPDMTDALRVWLQVGAKLGILGVHDGRYRIASRFAAKLADPANDDIAALLAESATLHQRLVFETPARVRASRWFTLDDQDGELIARSSRVLEPLVQEAIAGVVPARGPVRLLEIGCGSGTHIRFAASLNPALRAIGRELQADVARRAEENILAWGLTDRVAIEAGDVRERKPDEPFDLVTLHNNIYYFPVDQRVAFLRRVLGFLRPGGTLLLTTGCAGGGAEMEVLSLWGAATRGCGRLPEPEELVSQMKDAGFRRVEARSLLPGDRFFAFVGEA